MPSCRFNGDFGGLQHQEEVMAISKDLLDILACPKCKGCFSFRKSAFFFRLLRSDPGFARSAILAALRESFICSLLVYRPLP